MRIPSAIQLHKASKTLTLRYGEDSYDLPAEFLRVHSPSPRSRATATRYCSTAS